MIVRFGNNVYTISNQIQLVITFSNSVIIEPIILNTQYYILYFYSF